MDLLDKDVQSLIHDVEHGSGFKPTDRQQMTTLQSMIDCGVVWQLPRYWGVFAEQLIRAGILKAPT